jgi:SAM-dependent methyltransferase
MIIEGSDVRQSRIPGSLRDDDIFATLEGGVGAMGLYNNRILPWCIDVALRGPPIAEQRSAVLRDVKGEVLEVGFGTGLSLRYYGPGVTRLYALDPGTPPFKRVERRIARAPFPVVRLPFDPAQPYPLANGSVDAVTLLFTLCTIPDPPGALREIARVLKPTGSLFFLEHGLAESPRVIRWQRRLTPLWKHVGGGCHLDRDIAGLVEASGFRLQRHERCSVDGMPALMGRLYRGVAQLKHPDASIF